MENDFIQKIRGTTIESILSGSLALGCNQREKTTEMNHLSNWTLCEI